jgi:hypothetical protein
MRCGESGCSGEDSLAGNSKAVEGSMLVVGGVRVILMLLGVQHSVCVCRVSGLCFGCVDIILSRCDLQLSASAMFWPRTLKGLQEQPQPPARAAERFLPSLTL